MKASERLRELGERQREYGWPGPPVSEMFDALPLIADVVEAAEAPTLFDYDKVGEESAERLLTALTALCDALGDPPGWGADRKCPETCG